jgi:flagellar basal-body rod modification protein FlgD
MSTVGSTTGSSSSNSASSATSAANDPFSSLDLSDFLNLMITQLQQQDPTNPTDSNQILQELGTMASINSTSQLNTTLQGEAIAQGLSSAGALINANVTGLDDNGNQQNGTVSSVVINNGSPEVVVNGETMQLSNIQTIAQ